MPSSFGAKLARAVDEHGQLCVGIDPHQQLLEEWGLPDSAQGLNSFANIVLEAASGRVGIIKPQVSFFERFGSAGFKVLEDICVKASDAKLLNIMDVKRGDIGSTMEAYFQAWLGKNAPFVCDAITVSPYLGFDSLKPILAEAVELGKGIIVLSATSNPEGAVFQQAKTAEGKTVAASVWESLASINTVTSGAGERFGSFGAVLGATLNLNKFGLAGLLSEDQKVKTPILAPGFGAQGARLLDAGRLFGASASQVIANVSRSVLVSPSTVDELIDKANAELAEGLE
ncbi:MAG: orotidine-5'-phosphate decarboxylase [Micrococcales bacterium]